MVIMDYYASSITNGEGVRQVWFTAGCPHHCVGCQNPQTWEISNGKFIGNDRIAQISIESPFNVTFSGGDPLYQWDDLKDICKRIKPYKNIWIYTGYTWESIIKRIDYKSLLDNVDIIVDGRFVKKLADSHLQFRGSSNQRVIDVKRSLNEGRVVIWENLKR